MRITNKPRKGASQLISNFMSEINAGEAELSCYGDWSKAFDCVDATVLFGKLKSLDVQLFLQNGSLRIWLINSM